MPQTAIEKASRANIPREQIELSTNYTQKQKRGKFIAQAPSWSLSNRWSYSYWATSTLKTKLATLKISTLIRHQDRISRRIWLGMFRIIGARARLGHGKDYRAVEDAFRGREFSEEFCERSGEDAHTKRRIYWR